MTKDEQLKLELELRKTFDSIEARLDELAKDEEGLNKRVWGLEKSVAKIGARLLDIENKIGGGRTRDEIN